MNFVPMTKVSRSADVKVDFNEKTGKAIMPLHGMSGGPRNTAFVYDARPQFVEAGVPFVRLHDIEYPYGSGEFVDIPCIFKSFDADENDPASYNFALTDEYIRQTLSVGSKIIYRLGVSIEHSPVKRHTYPPKDYAKWARICEHIIRHYNEGWADGHSWNIEYWEIWNEPDAESTKVWAGTQKQFAEFYTVAARHLKACFPALKIGGCAFTPSKPHNVEAFLDYISSQNPRVPLDFFSWHCYCHTPDRMLYAYNRFKERLETVGYGDAESILDEWNYVESWDRLVQPSYYLAMKDHRGAAYYASMLCALQTNTDVAVATYYESLPTKEFCGVFNVKEMVVSINRGTSLAPTKGFYAFKRFNSLYRMENEVKTEVNTDTLRPIYVTAASGECGNGILLANQNIDSVSIKLKALGVKGDLVVRLTDELRTDEIIMTIPESAAEDVTLMLPAVSFIYIGTDLPDPVPMYEKYCYKNVSCEAPKDGCDTEVSALSESAEDKELNLG